MAFWKKRTFEHAWLGDTGVLETDLVHAVEITPELDERYLALLDDEFQEVHHWPESLIKHTARGLAAGRGIRHKLTQSTAALVLAEQPDVVVGFVSVEQLGVANEPYQVGLQIHRDYRKQGIVTGLLPALVERLGDAGLTDVALSTSKDNKAMIRVCNKLGYKHEAVQHRHPDGTVESARRYRLLGNG